LQKKWKKGSFLSNRNNLRCRYLRSWGRTLGR
jgi:hypothetical protein